jgi:uncharacterized protein DUF1501
MHHRFCDGLKRRDWLRIGAAGLFGTQLTLSGLLERRAQAANSGARPAKAQSLIYVVLQGGLSTIDTWDLKPDAPREFAGEFRPIDTNVRGIQITEHLPQVAGQMGKLSLIRSFGHRSSDHGTAPHYMLTGYFPRAGFNAALTPNNHYPSIGSIMAKKLGPRGTVPPYVTLPKTCPSGGAAYLGPSAAAFTIEADPSAPRFSVPDILPPLDIDASRLSSRNELLRRVDRYHHTVEAQANGQAMALDAFRQRAFELMVSPEAKRAFDIQAEPSRLRDAYGRNSLGQSCLMARRLIEAGVRCATVQHANWDTHDNNFRTLRSDLLPKLDAALATLFRDLEERGLLDSTLVVISGEFGRTPRINKNAGRDHWGSAFTVALGGGGIVGGRVEGRTDARAEKPAEAPHGPEDLHATLCTVLGIDPNEEFHTPEGRPVKIVNNGRPIRTIL